VIGSNEDQMYQLGVVQFLNNLTQVIAAERWHALNAISQPPVRYHLYPFVQLTHNPKYQRV
jgi:hypothetical protein